MKKLAKWTIAAAALSTLMFTSCGKKSAGDGKVYTYNEASTSVKKWSPNDWEMNPEGVVLSLVASPLYEICMDDAKTAYAIEPEMAASYPEDITASFKEKAKYGVPEDATKEYVYRIRLNKNACWEDGTKINADTYLYSMKQLLSPEMKNYRASNYYQDSVALANAKAYYAGGVDYSNANEGEVSDDELWTSLTQPVVFFGGAIKGYAEDEGNAEIFGDRYARLEEISKNSTYFKATDEVIAIFKELALGFGDTNPAAYKEFCFKRTDLEKVDFADVGLYKEDDYTLVFVLVNPKSEFMLRYGLTSSFLMYEPLFEKTKKQTGDIVKSTYGTSVDTSFSCGPYKVTGFQEGKDITLSKNENWYGYKDGKHKGQFMTTDVHLQFIDKHETVVSMFLQGKIETVELNSIDLKEYGNSEYRVNTPRSYTWKYTINMDRNALSKKNKKGENHSILAYEDFRHALSLSLDRSKYIETISPSSEAGFALLNNLYVADPVTGITYRESEPAKRILTEFYGTSSVEDITGYNKDEARELFVKAYNEAYANGDIKESDKIVVDIHVYAQSPGNIMRTTWFEDSVKEAMAGTVLDGRFSVNMVVDQDYYNSLKKGVADMALTAWGGSTLDPYGVMWCYCDPSAINEYGFSPMTEKLTITLDGEEITKTYNEWYHALCENEYVTAPAAVKNEILAQMEKALLSRYNMIPLEYDCVPSLNSQRWILGSDHYIPLIEFGSIRYLQYTMDDAEWDAYCAENNYKLTY